MSLRRYTSNAVETNLSSAITASDTSLTVVNSAGYPTPPFTVKIDNEAILVGAKSGNTFSSLTRGFDGTTAAAHDTTPTVQLVAVGDDFDYRWLDRKVSRGWGTYDDEFDDGTVGSGWTQVDPSGSVTWSEGYGVLSGLGGGQSSSTLSGIVKALPVLAPWSVETAVRTLARLENYTMAGLVFSDGTTAGSNVVAMFLGTTATRGDWYVERRTGTFSSPTSNVATQSIQHAGPWLYLRLNWTAINSFTAEFSPDGVSWLNMGWPTISLTFTPTHAGFCFSSWGATSDRVATFEYFRTYQP